VLEDFVKLLKELREEQDCQQIILGCTELPIIIGDCMKLYPSLKPHHLVDSVGVMVETVVQIAKRDIEIPKLLE
jgi:aspartate/glutamate racemase